MAHAIAADVDVMFGGSVGDVALGDTWQWDGELWTQVADTGPPARDEAAMAYDAARDQVVLFGGRTPTSGLGDTWIWDGSAWTQVADTGPNARSGHAMAYDRARQGVILCGGSPSPATADTWAWDGTAWTQLSDTGPVARSGHVMADVTGTRPVVLFGGTAATVELGDTWSWDGATWSQVADMGPPPRQKAAMVNDGANTILFGGVADLVKDPPSRLVYGDTWRWDGTRWTELQDIGPSPRFGHVMALGPDFETIALFGGSSRLVVLAGEITDGQSLLGDTWTYGFDPIAKPGPPGPEVSALSWDNGLSTFGHSNLDISAHAHLSGAVTKPTAVRFSVYAGPSATGSPVPASVVELLHPSMPIGPGSVTVEVLVRAGASGAPPGVYTLGAIVAGGAVLKTATFTVD